MEQTRLILAAEPGRLTAAGSWGLPMAHLAYRVGGGPHLFRANAPVSPRGGLLVMDAPRFQGGGEAGPFCNEVLRECTARRFTGVVCRFGPHPAPALAQLAGQVAQICAGRGLECYVSEGCGEAALEAAVVIPTALSGGSLRRRLEEAVERFGGGRVALWVDRVAQDFTLPAPTGEGERLTVAELARRREEQGRAVFFSDELCAHYFTYMVGETGHFVLFDDAGSIRKKLRLAAELGVTAAFLPYEETEDLLGELTGG